MGMSFAEDYTVRNMIGHQDKSNAEAILLTTSSYRQPTQLRTPELSSIADSLCSLQFLAKMATTEFLSAT
jgi:hypothetical protein